MKLWIAWFWFNLGVFIILNIFYSDAAFGNAYKILVKLYVINFEVMLNYLYACCAVVRVICQIEKCTVPLLDPWNDKSRSSSFGLCSAKPKLSQSRLHHIWLIIVFNSNVKTKTLLLLYSHNIIFAFYCCYCLIESLSKLLHLYVFY